MNVTKINAVFFSPTGTTEKITLEIANKLAEKLNVPISSHNYTLPQNRKEVINFQEGDLVVFGSPVYAGRIPNKTISYIQENFVGNGAIAIPIVTFGNRNFDDALMELRNTLEENEFHTVTAAAFPVEHVFSDKIALGRPDENDFAKILKFVDNSIEKISKMSIIDIGAFTPVDVDGREPIGPYYTPLGTDGKPAVFLKAKPVTDNEKCTSCGKCVNVCPMGSIDKENPSEVSGICIKCQSCVKTCPTSAKYFTDESFLSHVAMLEENYTARKEPFIFV